MLVWQNKTFVDMAAMWHKWNGITEITSLCWFDGEWMWQRNDFIFIPLIPLIRPPCGGFQAWLRLTDLKDQHCVGTREQTLWQNSNRNYYLHLQKRNLKEKSQNFWISDEWQYRLLTLSAHVDSWNQQGVLHPLGGEYDQVAHWVWLRYQLYKPRCTIKMSMFSDSQIKLQTVA